MARYRKTRRRNKQTLLPRMRRQPGWPGRLSRLPWWADPIVMAIVNARSETANGAKFQPTDASADLNDEIPL
jgi:hypothetical protein